jgi:hypothetical protein
VLFFFVSQRRLKRIFFFFFFFFSTLKKSFLKADESRREVLISEIANVAINTTVKNTKPGVMFEVRSKQKTPRGQDKSSTLYLVAPTQADADAWVAAIQNNMNALNDRGSSTGGEISLAVPSRDSGRSKSPVRSFVKSLGALVGIGGGEEEQGGDGGGDDDDNVVVEEDAELRRRKYEARAYIDSFDADSFKSSLESAMVVVKRVLDTTKNPKPINEVPHAYADKFALAERATHTAIRAVLVPLEQLGFDRKTQSRFRETVQIKKRPVELVLQAVEKCKFLRRTEREEEDAVRYVSEYSVGRLVSAITDRITHKTVRTIVEYHWRFDYEYRLVVRSGKDEHTLMRGTRHCELITPDDTSPRPEHAVRDELSLNITWLLQQLRSGKKVKKRGTDGSKSPRRSRSKSPRPSVDGDAAAAAAAAATTTTTTDDNADDNADDDDAGAADDERAPTRFVIERSVASCLTPRRNCDVEDALTFFYRAFNFCNEVTGYLGEVFSLHDDNVDASTFDVDTMFSPVVVLLDKGHFLPTSDTDALLAEQRRSIDEKLAAVKKSVGSASGLVGFDEARVVCMLAHAGVIGEQYSNTIDAVEALLEQQLVAALGRVIKPVDFDAYMQFHCRKLFVPSRAPSPFVYGVRRDATGCVEGVLSIDVDRGDGALPQPLHTLAAVHRNVRNWSFALGARDARRHQRRPVRARRRAALVRARAVEQRAAPARARAPVLVVHSAVRLDHRQGRAAADARALHRQQDRARRGARDDGAAERQGVQGGGRVDVARDAALRQGVPRHAARVDAVWRRRGAGQAAARAAAQPGAAHARQGDRAHAEAARPDGHVPDSVRHARVQRGARRGRDAARAAAAAADVGAVQQPPRAHVVAAHRRQLRARLGCATSAAGARAPTSNAFSASRAATTCAAIARRLARRCRSPSSKSSTTTTTTASTTAPTPRWCARRRSACARCARTSPRSRT